MFWNRTEGGTSSRSTDNLAHDLRKSEVTRNAKLSLYPLFLTGPPKMRKSLLITGGGGDTLPLKNN